MDMKCMKQKVPLLDFILYLVMVHKLLWEMFKRERKFGNLKVWQDKLHLVEESYWGRFNSKKAMVVNR